MLAPIICLLGQLAAPADIAGRVKAALQDKAVQTYSICVIDPSIEFRTAMRPGRMRQSCKPMHSEYAADAALLDLDAKKNPKLLRQCIAAMDHTKFIEKPGWKYGLDCRYALLAFDSHGKRVAYVAMEGSAVYAEMDLHVYRAKGALGPWFKRLGKKLLHLN